MKYPEFKKYSSIENITREKTLMQIHKMGFDADDVLWTVNEKFHGSNFSLILKRDENSDIQIIPGKRSSVLDPNDNFFSYRRALTEDLKSELVRCFQLFEAFGNMTSMQWYGEIVGGLYDAEGVERIPGATRVQKEVQYHPDNKIVFYDCVVQNGDSRLMLDQDFLEDIFAKNIKSGYFAKSLFTGTFHEAVEFSKKTYDQPTLAPQIWDLPEIEGNIREGNVLKPVIPKFFSCGSRVILKHKNETFKERHVKIRQKKKDIQSNFSPETMKLVSVLDEFITENRLNAVLSKIGDNLTHKDFGKILHDMFEDIIEDFKKEEEEMVNLLEQNYKTVSKLTKSNVAIFIRERFINIIDRSKSV